MFASPASVPLLDLLGGRVLQTALRGGRRSAGRSLECLGLSSPHTNVRGPGRAVKSGRENPPSGQPGWFRPCVHWASTTALGTRGSPCTSAEGAVVSGISSRICTVSRLSSPHRPLLSRGRSRGKGSSNSHRPAFLPCSPHLHRSQGMGGKGMMSPCPPSSVIAHRTHAAFSAHMASHVFLSPVLTNILSPEGRETKASGD